MLENATQFLLHWGITALTLWVASLIFSGLKFDKPSSLAIAALLLGFANAVVKPLLILLTLPLTLLTFGLFLLVINALLLLLTSVIADGLDLGFHVDGFLTAVLGSIVISIVSAVVGAILPD